MKKIVFLMAFFCIALTTNAQIYSEVWYLEGKKLIDNYSPDAYYYFNSETDKNNSWVQHGIARCYEAGLGVEQDNIEAIKWYKKAVDQGNVYAINNLAQFYFKGIGIQQNYEEGLKLIRLAANKGLILSQRQFGIFYFSGENGVTKDYAEALKWFKKAAEQGDSYSQAMIGAYYYHGFGVEKDNIEALKWFKKAAEQGDSYSQAMIGEYYYHGFGGLKRDKKEAEKWYAKSASLGNDWAKDKYKVLTGKNYKPNIYSIFAKEFVEDKVNLWQKKNEFETTQEYQDRVNERTRAAYIKKIVEWADGIYISHFQNDILNDFKLEKYDADNESFLFASKTQGNYVVKVPRKDAQSFKSNYEIDILHSKWAIVKNQPKIVQLSMKSENSTYLSDDIPYQHTEIAYNFADIELPTNSNPNIPSNNNTQIGNKQISLGSTSDIASNIPTTATKNENTFVVIIANEKYQTEVPVTFAANDGRLFKEYCMKTLGIPEKHIRFVENATLNNIKREIGWLETTLKTFDGKSKAIVYYSGHGIPDEASGNAFLLPVDGYGSDVSTGYSLEQLYKQLGEANAQSVTYFIDACFSGAKKEGGMLVTARGVAIKVKKELMPGNSILFSAAQGDETAYTYNEKGQGLFTYFLLKKLQETKGDVSYQDLGDYITTNVKQTSIVVNSKSQTPTVVPSTSIGDSWKNWKLK